MEIKLNLQEAIKSGNIDQVKKILAENPSLANDISDAGISFILLAYYYQQPEIAQMIAEHASELDIFSSAAIGHLDKVRKFVEENPSIVNEFSSDGFPLLGLAVYFGRDEIAKFLIDNGADVNIAAKNAAKVAPIHSAVSTKNLDLAKILLHNGANPNAVQQKNVTPLHGAAHNGDLAMVELLLEYGSDCDAKMDDGKTPLDMAVEKNFADIVEKLCKQERFV